VAAAKAGTLGDLLVDTPLPNMMTWDKGDEWASSVVGVDDTTMMNVGSSRGIGRSEVDSNIANDPEMDVTDVAYVAQGVQWYSVNVTCDDGRHGHAFWSGPVLSEAGIVTCGLQISDVSYFTLAIKVQSLYCV